MSIKLVYANRSQHSDFVVNAIEELTNEPCDVLIAVAFFTEASVIERLIAKQCRVRLVVRLGFPTSPAALQRLMGNPSVQIRFYTGHSFHPKLYIFGAQSALVGSANLTSPAIRTNEEVVVSISADDERFNHLGALFEGYWEDEAATVLEQCHIDDYRVFFDQFDRLDDQAFVLGRKVLEKFGDRAPRGITTMRSRRSGRSLFLDGFKKSYQSSLNAFGVVRGVYERHGYRKVPETVVPLAIEIDSFLSFVRDRHAVGNSWSVEPVRFGAEQERFIEKFIDLWAGTSWPHLEVEIAATNYPRIQAIFGSRESILSASDSDLFDALTTLHSFHDRLRFYKGGMNTWKETFGAANAPSAIRETLAELVFGSDPVEERMARVIYDPAYKPDLFGRSNVQELIGWCKNIDRPIINGRTTKILRFFGSDVHQL